MAIELRKALADPEFNSRLWGTSINPNSYYRVLGGTGVEGMDVYKDVLETGAVRGSRSFAGDAYFSKGAPQGIYLHNQSNLRNLLQHYPVEEVGNNNFFIEATKDFHPDRNPLYKPNATLTHKPLPSIGGVQAPAELAFPNSGSGSRWLTTVDSTGLPVPEGTYVTAAPAENTTFLQRINPKNQRHLRMGQAYTPMFNGAVKGFEGGAPEWKWLFDYTKDFSKTSIPQHGRNALHIGRTIMAQPETQAVVRGAGKYALPAVAVAVTPFDAVARRDRNFTDFYNRTGREPKGIEDYKLRVQSGLEPALSMATFGAYDALMGTPTYTEAEHEFYKSRGKRNEIQMGIDYPLIYGEGNFTRTTK